MRLIRTGHNKVKIQRNKKHGKRLIVKWTPPERASCTWCCLARGCNNNHPPPCSVFLPDNVFFIDEDKNNKRRKISRGEKK